MEQCNEMASASLLDTSFNVTNPSAQTSRLSSSAQTNSNVSFLKRRLFEDEDEEEEDVNLLPEDDEVQVNIVTSTQRAKSPPRCDSETEVNNENLFFLSVRFAVFFSVQDDHRISSPSHRLIKQTIISPINSSFLFDVDCSPIRKT